MVFTALIITDTFQVCTITIYIISLHTGGALSHSASSWPVHSINTEFYTQKKEDHRGLYFDNLTNIVLAPKNSAGPWTDNIYDRSLPQIQLKIFGAYQSELFYTPNGNKEPVAE